MLGDMLELQSSTGVPRARLTHFPEGRTVTPLGRSRAAPRGCRVTWGGTEGGDCFGALGDFGGFRDLTAFFLAGERGADLDAGRFFGPGFLRGAGLVGSGGDDSRVETDSVELSEEYIS